MSEDAKINDVISISQEKILEKYSKMEKFFINIIKELYAGKIRSFCMKGIIKENRNDYKELKILNNKTGCYMFLCEGVPVYIGVGGKNVNGRDLYKRVTQQCRKYDNKSDTGVTLSKNIQTIDELLGEKNVSPDYSMEKIKSFDLIPIVVGEITNEKDVYKAKALETILIALFHPKYNK